MATQRAPAVDREVPVLLAGGGLVGLSTAMFRPSMASPPVAIQRLRRVSALPRAAHFHLRTLELFLLCRRRGRRAPPIARA